MSLYDKYILPSFLNCACGSKPINYQRQKVVPLAEGIILAMITATFAPIGFSPKNEV